MTKQELEQWFEQERNRNHGMIETTIERLVRLLNWLSDVLTRGKEQR